jgi:hypothetical protein
MCRIAGEVAAAVGEATVLDTCRAIGADALATATVDRHQVALADAVAGATVVQIGLQIHAGTRALTVGETGVTSRHLRRGSPRSAGGDRGGGEEAQDSAA